MIARVVHAVSGLVDPAGSCFRIRAYDFLGEVRQPIEISDVAFFPA
jgi:hypothetical protein